MDTIQSLDPASCLLQVDTQFLSILFADLDFSGLAVGVVGLVIDDDQILVACQLTQDSPDIRLIAFDYILDHRAILLLQWHQGVPILDQ